MSQIGPGSWIIALCEEWESEICAVCGSDKWRNFPFCRRCSIRLQRIGLMKELKPYGGHSFGVLLRKRMVRYYDLCRDYLVCTYKKVRNLDE
jgi:hypothetical protein